MKDLKPAVRFETRPETDSRITNRENKPTETSRTVPGSHHDCLPKSIMSERVFVQIPSHTRLAQKPVTSGGTWGLQECRVFEPYIPSYFRPFIGAITLLITTRAQLVPPTFTFRYDSGSRAVDWVSVSPESFMRGKNKPQHPSLTS